MPGQNPTTISSPGVVLAFRTPHNDYAANGVGSHPVLKRTNERLLDLADYHLRDGIKMEYQTSRTAVRTALVTGASRGIGSAIATRLALNGIRVAIHFGRSQDDAMQLAAILRSQGAPDPLVVKADVADADAVRDLVMQCEDELDGLDLLVNNAGIYLDSPFDMPNFDEWADTWATVLNTNLMSAVHAVHTVLPGMRERGFGKIINVASRSAFRAETSAPAYAVSKAGMVNLTRCVARAEAVNGIRAYCIAPGWVETAMARDAVAAMHDEIVAQIPMGRIATVQDVAGVAAFLASPDADYLTGITIDVNGGSYLH